MRADIGQEIRDKIVDEIPEFWSLQIKRYTDASGLSLDYSRKELVGVLRWVVGEWELEMDNENWTYDIERGGNAAVIKELQKLTDRIWESALWYTEKGFGYDEAYEARPKTKGEAWARQVFEIFKRSDDEFFAKMGEDLRASEFAKSKTTVKRMNDDIQRWMKLQISRLITPYKN